VGVTLWENRKELGRKTFVLTREKKTSFLGERGRTKNKEGFA